jgi:hypothetical protein
MQKIEMVGLRFGRLMVTAPAESDARGQARFVCICDCGSEKTITARWLRCGNTSSCGCLMREKVSARRRKHGRIRTPEYRTWMNMKSRCQRPEVAEYRNYGGRGISICERWSSFEAFFQDMGPRPTLKHSIDRVDPNGNYEPSNCRWATCREQQNNRRNNVYLEWDGVTLSLSEMARKVGLKPSTLHRRIKVAGWPVADALTRELHSKSKRARVVRRNPG